MTTETYIARLVLPAAYTLLPAGMASPRASAQLIAIGRQESDGWKARGGKINGVGGRLQRPPAPHHGEPTGAAQIMADQQSNLPPVHSRSANGTPLYERTCSCGAVGIVDKRRLRKPCASCAAAMRRTHGLASRGALHPLYKLLKNIQARCSYPSATNYGFYGGRGITVCQEWIKNPLAFVAWAEANGWKPGLEIDRIDVDGHYEPSNCRFVTHRENSRRTRRIKTTPEKAALIRSLLASGVGIKDAADRAGVTYMTAWHIKNSPGVWQ